MNSLEEKNKKFLSMREITNKVVSFRELYFEEENPIATLYVMEHYDGGFVVPLKIHASDKFQKLLSQIKKPEEDKDQRIKEMGIKIAELNKKLKEI